MMPATEHTAVELKTQAGEATAVEPGEPERPSTDYVLVARHMDYRTPASTIPAPGLAERQGPNVLMCMGVGLFLVAVIFLFTGHSTLGLVLAVVAVITEVVSARLARLELLKLEALKLVFLAKFRSGGPADPST